MLLRESGRGGNNTSLTAVMAVFLNRAAATWSRGELSRSFARHSSASFPSSGFSSCFARSSPSSASPSSDTYSFARHSHLARACRARWAITARDARFLLLVAALQRGAFALEHLGALAHAPELFQLRLVRLGLLGTSEALPPVLP